MDRQPRRRQQKKTETTTLQRFGTLVLVRPQRLELEVGGISRDVEDTKGVGVTQTALPALDGNDGRAWSDEIQFQGILQTKPDAVVDVCLPLVCLDASGLGVPEGIAAPVEVNLSCSLLVAGDWKGIVSGVQRRGRG